MANLLVFSLLLGILTSCADKVSTKKIKTINSDDYYGEFNGHQIDHLKLAYEGLKEQGCKSFIFYAGDSSLDNKHWIKNSKENATNGYENILKPPVMVMDVDYFVNKRLLANHPEKKMCSIMTSVEASKLEGHNQGEWPQDEFIKNHISTDDYLIVSVGGNDTVLGPNEDVKNALGALLKNQNNQKAFNVLKNIFADETKAYIENLIKKQKPKKIIICMIYYPSEVKVTSWVGEALEMFGYDKNPALVQGLIKRLFNEATKTIKIDKVDIEYLALFEVLDHKSSDDYIQRIEPSVKGSQKMAQKFIDLLLN